MKIGHGAKCDSWVDSLDRKIPSCRLCRPHVQLNLMTQKLGHYYSEGMARKWWIHNSTRVSDKPIMANGLH